MFMCRSMMIRPTLSARFEWPLLHRHGCKADVPSPLPGRGGSRSLSACRSGRGPRVRAAARPRSARGAALRAEGGLFGPLLYATLPVNSSARWWLISTRSSSSTLALASFRRPDLPGGRGSRPPRRGTYSAPPRSPPSQPPSPVAWYRGRYWPPTGPRRCAVRPSTSARQNRRGPVAPASGQCLLVGPFPSHHILKLGDLSEPSICTSHDAS